MNEKSSGGFLRSVAFLASSAALAQLISVFASPILTRLYTPEEFGFLAAFTSMLMTIMVVSCLRYELAIPLPATVSQARILFRISSILNGICAALVLLIVLFFGGDISAWLKMPELNQYLWILPISVIALGLYKVNSYWAIRERRYGAVSATRLTQAAATVSVQLGAGVVGFGPVGLIVGQVLGQSIGARQLSLSAVEKPSGGIGARSISKVRVIARRYASFPKYDAPAALLNSLSSELPILMLSALFSPIATGYYYLAQRVLATPMAFVGLSVSQVLHGHMQEAKRAGRLLRQVLLTAATLAALSCAFGVVIFWGGEQIFSIVFGADWRPSGQYAELLIFGICAQFIYSPISVVLLAVGGQQLNLYINLLMFVLRAFGILYGWMQNDVYTAILGYSIGGALCYLIGIFAVFVKVRSTERVSGRVA